jgi:hypothetical protein
MRWKLDPERPYQFHVDTSIQAQLDYLIDLQGKLQMNFIGHYENLNDDFQQICETIGIPQMKLPHKRQAKDRKQDYRSYYSDDLAELVGQYFKRDIEALDYRFDG